MTLNAGAQLGHFEILGMLGMGGMGEVYHARDLKLGREVAVKLLPERVAHDAALLQRFEREARALAALNHPHIGALYSFEREGQTPFLVMELIGGRTLQERLRAGPMPLEDVLGFFAQIAEALEAAHERGIIHRDLKPANIKITDEERVKILDFGLAKAFEPPGSPPSSGGTVALEPESGLTSEGAIVGTIGYMSPEQARGKAVDKRTDIWAFGCMLYEALSGKRAFSGPTVQDTLAGVLEREPAWDALPPETPPNLASLLRRCLQKDPQRRLQDIGDARIELEETLKNPKDAWGIPADGRAAVRGGGRPRLALGVVLGIVVGAAAVALFAARMGPDSEREGSGARSMPVRFTFSHPAEFGPARVEMPALSRDGRHLVYAASRRGSRRLYHHDLSTDRTQLLTDTDGASGPFLSPDGEWVGFFHFDTSKLKKVSMQGGRSITLADSQVPVGGLWAEDGFIYYTATLQSGLFRVPAAGGPPEAVSDLDRENGDLIHTFPNPLPGRRELLATRAIRSYQQVGLVAIDPTRRGASPVPIMERAAFARYLPGGRLIFFRDRALYGAEFDPARLRVLGPGVALIQELGLNPLFINIAELPQYAISDNGTLAYVGRSLQPKRMVWVDESGNESEAADTELPFRQPRFSPDGRQVAVTVDDEGGSNIWIGDIERGTFSRFTFEGYNFAPVWSPDGRSLVFTSTREGLPNLYIQASDGSAGARRVTRGQEMHVATAWRPGSDEIAFIEFSAAHQGDLYVIRPGDAGDKESWTPLLPNTPYDENKPSFSPDGRWVAYESNESGPTEIYVRTYPDAGGKLAISNRGGLDPLWSPDGTALYYVEGYRMMKVDFDPDGAREPSKPRMLFEGPYVGDDISFSYDVCPRTGRLLMITHEEESVEDGITIVVNWFQDLDRMLPASPGG
jgi:eukaryotic-like serine/threonine-protein kinase